MPQLKGTRTHENLKHAFTSESQANRRYLYFARRADIEGYLEIGGLFRDTAEAETGNAFGHLDFLKEVGDPATGFAIGNTDANLKSAVEGETYECTQMYPGFARTVREEGLTESRSGSRRSRERRSLTRAGSRRGSTTWASFDADRRAGRLAGGSGQRAS